MKNQGESKLFLIFLFSMQQTVPYRTLICDKQVMIHTRCWIWVLNSNTKKKEREGMRMYDYQTSAEAVLIRRAKRGDIKAFSELYSRIYVELYKFALYTLKHPQEAEDAVSETVMTAYEKISSLKKEESFRSWIFTILSNHCKNQFRKRQLAYELDDEVSPSEDFDYAALQDVKRAFWQLEDEERLIVSYSVFGGYQSDEIGQMLNMNPATVRSRKKRALEKMRTMLQEMEVS